MDFFNPEMSRNDLLELNSLGLAHMGDAVYEVLVRGWLCSGGRSTARNLHKDTVSMVCAPAQARAAQILLPYLSEAETAVYKRGRNAHISAVPKRATRSEYLMATGLEALFGWLYLSGRRDRICELFELITETEDQGDAV